MFSSLWFFLGCPHFPFYMMLCDTKDESQGWKVVQPKTPRFQRSKALSGFGRIAGPLHAGIQSELQIVAIVNMKIPHKLMVQQLDAVSTFTCTFFWQKNARTKNCWKTWKKKQKTKNPKISRGGWPKRDLRPPEQIAKTLALAAQERSMDPRAKVDEMSFVWTGGSTDDKDQICFMFFSYVCSIWNSPDSPDSIFMWNLILYETSD